ncbi:putative choline transport protein [Aspergillus lucknowensis]|uniref:Uncharacterized protein n=1 Tax=Aspergillus lucknowensis TaxID=176173 RepID=A0ABR4LU14_9EURO
MAKVPFSIPRHNSYMPSPLHRTSRVTGIWAKFIYGSGGWPEGISFSTGLSTPQFMVPGLNATFHLAEECLDAETVVPKVVLVTVMVGFLTAFPLSIGKIYSYRDEELSLTTKTRFPIYFTWETIHSPAAATVFMASLFVISCVALNAVHQTASRLT